MIYLSKLLNCAVHVVGGQRIGYVSDLIVDPRDVFPRVTALAIGRLDQHSKLTLQHHAEGLIVSIEHVLGLDEGTTSLVCATNDLEVYRPSPYEIQLARDVLDKQIVDTEGRRIVKVNDVKLGRIKGHVRLVGIDISLRGFLRRLGAERTIDLLERVLPLELPERLITWNYVEPTAGEAGDVRLNVAHTQLADLHPADVADIIEAMAPSESANIWRQMDEETAAETLEEMEVETQRQLLKTDDPLRVSRILAKMNPDDAADVLGDLSKERAERFLSLMDARQAADVRELLRYDEHTAGGLMTTEVFTLPEHLTSEQAISFLRTTSPSADNIYYLFVVDESRRLVGVVSLRDLVTAPADQSIAAVMNRDTIKVRLDDDQAEVARVIAHYDLLAVPVVDENDVLKGLITVDDIIDVIHEEADEDIGQLTGAGVAEAEHVWLAVRNRLGWFGLSIVGGMAAALLILRFVPTVSSSLLAVAFLPLLLSLAHDSSGQSLAIVTRGIAQGLAIRAKHLYRELAISALIGLVCGSAVVVVVASLTADVLLGALIGGSLLVTMLVCSVLGGALPLALKRLRLDPLATASPVLYPVVAVASVLIYLNVLRLA